MVDFKKLLHKGLGTPLIIIIMLGMLILPLPPIALDLLFTFNIALSLIILLASVYTVKPLNFSVFPSLLLVATLLRLTLNIASTRVVLLHGHTGADAAGKVIQAFGEIVIGGNFAVGIVIFAILVIINFVVVTKGAGRVSEVSARFTLDAMPGKQMAIDADLNAGLINQEEAKRRRLEVSEEADFYGAMDGSSKFVRGDAIAGLLILFINILGGIIIGIAQHNLSFGEASNFYTLLSIGDGLVAQIPALLLSTAAAIMVTRTTKTQDMGTQMSMQLFSHPKTFFITGGMIALIGIIPGMPHLAFLGLASSALYIGYWLKLRNDREVAAQKFKPEVKPDAPVNKELDWNDVQPVDTIGLEVGYRLITLVDVKQGGQLMMRIKGMRKKLSQEMGFLMPTVHVRDNLDIAPTGYRICVLGVTLAQSEVYLDKDLAINPGQVFGEMKGIAVKDPAFGLPALWIDTREREQAQSLGFTVVDSSTVIATHLSRILQEHAAELLGHEEVQQLLTKLTESNPKLVEALVPSLLTLSQVLHILQRLLEERIPLVDLRTIAETLVEYAPKNADPEYLVSMVRVALKRLMVQTINGAEAEIAVMTLDPDLEHILQQSLQASRGTDLAIEPTLAEKIFKLLHEFEQRQSMQGKSSILLVSSGIRHIFARFMRASLPGLHVLAYQEIPDDKQIKVLGTIGR